MEDGLFSKIRNGIKDMCYIWAKEMRSTITDEGVLIFFILVPLLLLQQYRGSERPYWQASGSRTTLFPG